MNENTVYSEAVGVCGEKNDDNNLVYACMGVKERFAGPDHIEYKNNKLHKVTKNKYILAK